MRTMDLIIYFISGLKSYVMCHVCWNKMPHPPSETRECQNLPLSLQHLHLVPGIYILFILFFLEDNIQANV